MDRSMSSHRITCQSVVSRQFSVVSKCKSIELKDFGLLIFCFCFCLCFSFCFYAFPFHFPLYLIFFCLVTHTNEFSAAPFLRLFIPFRLSAKPKIRKLASLKQSGFITV